LSDNENNKENREKRKAKPTLSDEEIKELMSKAENLKKRSNEVVQKANKNLDTAQHEEYKSSD
jgi:hypothetical protein